MKNLIALSMFLFALFVSQVAGAWEPVDDETVRVSATYTESTTDINNKPLRNLDRIDHYYSIGEGPTILAHSEPATGATGGAKRSIVFNIAVAAGMTVTPKFYMVAVAGTESSINSSIATLLVDRWVPVAPKAPTDYIVE